MKSMNKEKHINPDEEKQWNEMEQGLNITEEFKKKLGVNRVTRTDQEYERMFPDSIISPNPLD